MSHRKFERPRRGNLGFLPRKRAKHHRGRIRSFPADDKRQDCHLTAFMGFKAGMTHIVRDVERPGSKLHKKEVVESATILETPPLVVVGITGYVNTPGGLRCLHTVFAEHLSEQFKRKYYKNWKRSHKRAFTRHVKKYQEGEAKLRMLAQLEELRKHCCVIRAICHTQVRKLRRLGRKKADIIEIQVNGGNVPAKVAFVLGLFEKEVSVSTVFKESEYLDAMAVTTGHGFEGVTHRWGTTRLPRKTHKGLRKVACIGAWHPSRVAYSVPRAGQNGYHHRCTRNLKIYKIGESYDKNPANARCEGDITDKPITPMGGFVNYGTVKNEWLLLKGCTPGPKRRPVCLRRPMYRNVSRLALEKVNLKFIDTSSKLGHGRFQTSEEKRKFMGPTKKSALKKEKKPRPPKA